MEGAAMRKSPGERNSHAKHHREECSAMNDGNTPRRVDEPADLSDVLTVATLQSLTVPIPVALLFDAEVPASALRLWGLIAHRANSDGWVEERQENLAADLDVDVKTVQRWVRALRERRWLVVEATMEQDGFDQEQYGIAPYWRTGPNRYTPVALTKRRSS